MIHHLLVALRHGRLAEGESVLPRSRSAYIARKLDAIQEGERTLLDNSMLLFCSSMLTGGHDATQAARGDARRRRAARSRPAACSITSTSRTARCAACTCR